MSLAWVANSATLIHGDRDAVLVGTSLMVDDSASIELEGHALIAVATGSTDTALVLPGVCTRLSINTLVTLASGSYALVLAAVALLHDAVPVLLLLIRAGVAWVVVLSTLNASLQLFLPAWVRGRSLAA